MNKMSFAEWAPPPRRRVAAVSFSGDRSEFGRLVTRGGFLEIVTLGFYRFWLATDMRRHLWSNTTVDGDAPEYTGTGRELLIGFLIALAIIVPIYLAYFLLTVEVERLKVFGGIPLLAFFYVFGQFAIYRARRYRLTRTVWRGVRFWMDGSGWAYALRASLWMILVVITLGLAWPWREAALERYKMQHSYYGDLQGGFKGTGWEFVERGWILWLLTLFLFAVAVVFRPMVFLIVLVSPALYASFRAVEWRWWISGLRFGDISFASGIRLSGLISLYYKALGWFALIDVVVVSAVFLCFAAMANLSGVSLPELSRSFLLQNRMLVVALCVPLYLSLLLLVNIVIRLYFMRDLWMRIAASATVYGIEAANSVRADGELASAIGEGLADGLGVASF